MYTWRETWTQGESHALYIPYALYALHVLHDLRDIPAIHAILKTG